MLHVLRQYRRSVSAALVAALLVWLMSSLAACLLLPMSGMADAAMAGGMVAEQAEKRMSEMPQCPGGICAIVENDRPPVADQPPVPTTPKLLLIALFVTMSLLPAGPERSRATPPEPPLPKRSPVLRFYALRI